MMRILIRLPLLTLVAIMSLPFVARADIEVPPPEDDGTSSAGGLTNPLRGVNNLNDFLTAILNGLIEIGTIVLIMMLVYVGFLFVAARGNPESITKARSALLWTVIGGLILLGATAIQAMITGTVNSLR